MTIQDDPDHAISQQDMIDALNMREASLVYAYDAIADLTVKIYYANKGDRDVRDSIIDAIKGTMHRLSAVDDNDLICRLRDQLSAEFFDIFELPRVGFDARSRSYTVRAMAQEIVDSIENAAYLRERRRKLNAKRAAGYAAAYDAAMRLTPSQRIMLAEAILS